MMFLMRSAIPPEEAENLKLRADRMRELARRIAGMSQPEAADLLGVTQPRISELVRGKINFFLRFISWSTWRRGPVLMRR